ncbi:TPA: hypothetical protein ACQ49P_005346 [Pseudomonas aeruginosa]
MSELKPFFTTDYETEYANGRRGQVLVVKWTDYAALAAELKRVSADRAACWAEFKALVKTSNEKERYLREDLEALRTDAERYRWLRERDLETISRGGVFAGMTPENIVLNLEDLDAEIDAARFSKSDAPAS